jgi:peptidyl-tRNA hydrolase, PTH1 family
MASRLSAFRNSERTGTPAEWLIVGLGNPGTEYAGTRHNVGAEVVDVLAARHGAKLKFGKERAISGETRIGGVLVALAFPQTFMNLSGESVRMLVKRHGIASPSQIIVVHDELDIPSARLKLKFGGGVAGHNGLKSIRAHMNSPDFCRVRIGIGRPPGTQQTADYVLKRPGKAERVEFDIAVQQAADAVEQIVAEGIDRAMNTVNTKLE